MKMILAGGARGVGKTSIFSALEHLRLEDYSMKVIHSSRELQELATSSYGQRLNGLDDGRKGALLDALMEKALSSGADVIIFDTHYVELDRLGRASRLIPAEHERLYSCHMLVEATAKEILSRRLNDASRTRNLDPRLIGKEIEAERATAMEIAARTGTPLYTINNISLTDAILTAKGLIELVILKRD